MRRFKLLKWYPGLPLGWKEGEIIVEKSGISVHYHLKNVKSSTSDFTYTNHVENNPDYWKELKPLFTTEDGINIYKDETSYLVSKSNGDILGPDYYVGDNKKNFYYFSTIEAAKKWVNENKPKIWYGSDIKFFGKYFHQSIEKPVRDDKVWFETKEERDLWIVTHQPTYSLEDLSTAFFAGSLANNLNMTYSSWLEEFKKKKNLS